MRTYKKEHTNTEALKNHKKALEKRGAKISIEGKTITYYFPKKSSSDKIDTKTKTFKKGSKVEFITIAHDGVQVGKIVGIGDYPTDLPKIAQQEYYLIKNRKGVWNIPVANIYKIGEVP